MMRMLEEMTGFDFFWHHHVSNFRGATLDNGEENNYCSSLTSNQNTSVQLFHAADLLNHYYRLKTCAERAIVLLKKDTTRSRLMAKGLML